MASASEIHVLDTVELTEDVGDLPAGTIGAVVSEYPASALVELLSDDPESDLLDDLVSVPYESLQVIGRRTHAVH